MDMDTKLMLMEANIHGYYQGVKDTIKEVLKMAYDMSEIDGEHFTESHMVVDVEDIQKLLPSVEIEDIEPTTRKSCETCIGKSRYVDGMDLCEDCEECSNFKPKQTEETIDKYAGQEPCDDTISRQAAKDLFCGICMENNICYRSKDTCEDLKLFNQLPSVRPKPETVTEFADRCRECGARYGKLLKQKTGHWINMEISINGDMSAECDKCGCIVRNSFTNNAINYCPNCGACMKDGRTLDEFIEDSKESEENE